jgi:HD superfamily phosphohydrolase
LGVNEYVYPGATHTRFSHSVGTLHIARQILRRLEQISAIPEEIKSIVQVTALLHDIGHGPFSHAIESVIGRKHELWSDEIIRSDETEVHKHLSKCKLVEDLPEKVCALLIREPNAKPGKSHSTSEKAYLAQIVSSQLDADRFDYLLRDSHFTGTQYGRFDLPWLIQNMFVYGDRGLLTVGRKGMDAAYEYILARHHMFRSVYYHKTVRAAEMMINVIFKRLKYLQDGERREFKKVKEALPRVSQNLICRTATLENYLKLDDFGVWYIIRVCADSADPILSFMGKGLLSRNLLKCHTQRGSVGFTSEEKFKFAAMKELKKQGYDPDFTLIHDEPGDTPYKPFDFESAQKSEEFAEQLRKQIWVEKDGGGHTPIVNVCPAISALEPYRLFRWYYPSDAREKLDKLSTLLYT